MTLRKYVLDAAFEQVVSKTRLRRPQREALEEFHELLCKLPADLHELSQADLVDALRDLHPEWQFHEDLPSLTCALATGVGKTRLMGAMMGYLYLSKQSTNFCLVAPRTEVLRKLIAESQRGHPKFIFGHPDLIPEPQVWHADNLETFRKQQGLPFAQEGPNIFVLSPQSLAGENRRAWAPSEFSGTSPAEYLRSAKDLVIFADEAHHFGAVAEESTSAWAGALRALEPRLAVGMTATPRRERGTNLLYSYDLATCLREQMYTKAVRVIVREKSGDSMTDTEWDRHTLDFAIDRLGRKEAAVEALVNDGRVSAIKPVILVCAEDTAHADQVGKWLVDHRGFTEDQVLIVHSKRTESERELRRLVEVESTLSPVRVIVNVQKLTEGWDVSNVYVIAPLRAMGTFTGAVQAMGRGLRLPMGRRVGDKEVDTLDVLCFGRESLQDILDEALSEFGSEEELDAPIEVSSESSFATGPVVPKVHVDVPVGVPSVLSIPAARRVPNEPDLDFETGDLSKLVGQHAAEFELAVAADVSASSSSLTYEYEVFVRLCTGRVLAGLPYLSEPLHRSAVEVLVIRALEASGHATGSAIKADWVMLAEGIKDRIDGPYRRQVISFEADGTTRSLAFSPVRVLVPEDDRAPIARSSVTSWSSQWERRLIGGWKRCVYTAAIFDGAPELAVADILDRDADVLFWLRNDPAQLIIPTPIGRYEPDFVISTKSQGIIVLEVKGGAFWQPPDSDARVKSRSATAWCEALTSASGAKWSHVVVLDSDVPSALTLQDLVGRSAANP